MAIERRFRILLVDSYDSFTFNLASLCRQSIPNCSVHIIKNDQVSLSKLLPHLGVFSAIVVGPGPGSPDNASDIGIVKDLWKVPDHHLLPIFGVCLGLQSLGIEFGAKLQRLNVVKHGQISKIHHTSNELFRNVGKTHAVRYHSLHVKLDGTPELEKLAWADDGVENGEVIMALKHTSKPFWAVQYHPESVRTDGAGAEVLRNFWSLANSWSEEHSRDTTPWNPDIQQLVGPAWPLQKLYTPQTTPRIFSTNVTTRVLDLPSLCVTTVCDALGAKEESKPFVLLDSAAQPGRFSIIGSLTPLSLRLSYYTHEPYITITNKEGHREENLGGRDVWSWLASFMRLRRAHGGSSVVPFWGGLVGHLSYELGVNTMGVPPMSKPSNDRHADINLVYVERSIVIDQNTGKVYIQSLLEDDLDWLEATARMLAKSTKPDDSGSTSNKRRKQAPPLIKPTLTLPEKANYKSRIRRAQESLFAGDSYELCLTANTRISTPVLLFDDETKSSSSWERYKMLRQANPAPHSAYLRLHPTTLVSSSPERFLSFSRAPGTICQLRPIKGTVRKGPGVTREVAEEMLVGSPKEVAENLMIVDLIRHDLHGVVGDDVVVKQFCKVEEYETLWQLVSVIEGRPTTIVNHDLDAEAEVGWNVLKRSLPPGSMTGAPKKRSVEILQTLEGEDRGVYSGVFGYWCVSGAGDWSVTIRSCFKYDTSFSTGEHGTPDMTPDNTTTAESKMEDWVVGAGGAITALSDPDAEWDEMVTKLQSVLKAFGFAVQ